MIEDAGAAGEEVTVYGNNDDPMDKVTRIRRAAQRDGLDATPEILDGGVYFQTIGNEKTAAQTGFANWFQDFPHPSTSSSWLTETPFSRRTTRTSATWTIREITDTINELLQEPDLESVTSNWEELNRYLV